MNTRYDAKKKKYSKVYTQDRVVPVIIGYNGVIMEKSIIGLKVVPEVDINKLYNSIYYHIAWA